MLPDDLPDVLERLIALGRVPEVNIRPVLLRVLVDLFVGKPSHGTEAVRQFEEIASRLLDEADAPARLLIASKLAGHPQTPKALLFKLLAERGEAATAILSRAGLESEALQAAATLGTSAMAEAVAGRTDLDAATAQALAERPEATVLTRLAANPSLPADERLLRTLANRARDHQAVAERLLARGDDPITHAALFMSATRGQRAAIIAALRRHDLGLPRGAPVAGGAAACARIAHVALMPGQDELALVLCHALDLPAFLAEEIVDDPGGEALALALAALGASPVLAARVFILGPPAIGHSYAAVKALTGIVETISPGAARRLIDSLRGERAITVPRRTDRTERERSLHGLERREATPAPAIRKVG